MGSRALSSKSANRRCRIQGVVMKMPRRVVREDMDMARAGLCKQTKILSLHVLGDFAKMING